MKTPVTRRQALAATSALALAFAANAGELEKVGMQLILAADVSGSVNSARYKTQQDGYLEALGDSRVLNVIAELDPPVLAIAFVAWAREQAVMVPWMRVQDAKSMELFRNRLKQAQRPQIGINTLISKALLFCDARFDQEFTGGRKVIDVSGDGDDNQGIAALHDVRDALIEKGVVINGLPIIVKPPEHIFPQQPSEGLDVYYRNHAKDMYSSNQSASIISNKRSCRSCCSRLDDRFRRSIPSACALAAVTTGAPLGEQWRNLLADRLRSLFPITITMTLGFSAAMIDRGIPIGASFRRIEDGSRDEAGAAPRRRIENWLQRQSAHGPL
jgi:hypothetical protein